MTQRFSYASLKMLIVGAAVAACQSPESSAEVVTLRSAIRGGELSREFAATGMLVSRGELHCTATLVAPDIILTAAHCMYPILFNGVALEFAIGADPEHRARSVPVTQIVVHPGCDNDALIDNGHDIAIAHLAEPTTEVAPAVLFLGDASSLLNQTLKLVGYGAESVDASTNMGVGSGPRRATSVTVADLFDEDLGYNVQGTAACVGDSGGPAFAKFGDSYAQVGVDSFGDSDCSAIGRYQRLDSYRDWLASVGVPITPRQVTCVEDQICDGQCESDPDCTNLVCPLGPDDVDCMPVEAPAAVCTTFTHVPGMDGLCYYTAADNSVCDTVAIDFAIYERPQIAAGTSTPTDKTAPPQKSS